MYIELVQGLFTNRPGLCIPYEQLRGYIRRDMPLYRSTYLFSEPFEGSVSNYMGSYSINNIVLDVDSDGDYTSTKERTMAVIDIVNDLVGERRYLIYFSGNGFHIVFNAKIFNFPDSERLPQIVKATLQSIFEDWVDLSIYSKTSIYRVAHTINQKSGLYKIPIHYNELLHEDIKELAKEPRHGFTFSDYDLTCDGELSDMVVDPINIQETHVFEPFKIASCIHNLWKRGPRMGERHQTILRLTSHFRRHGFPIDAAISAISNWLLKNNKEFSESELQHIVTYGYNKGYIYSCSDDILEKSCSPQCIYYKDKDYESQILNSHNLHDAYVQRISTDFSNSALPVSKMLNINKDVDFMPGDLVTVFGLTGAGKTAFAQNLAIGMNINGVHKEEYKLPTLYLSLEISPWLMYRRQIQILYNLTKSEVTERYKFDKPQQAPAELSHILTRSISPDLRQLEKEIYEYEPRLVIVDYIELLNVDVQNDRAKIKEITRYLRRLVNKMQIIIIQISQVGREYSRAQVLDLYAGKESGSIECDSTKVIGMWGNSTNPEKKIEYFKNTDGEIGVQYIKMLPSFRMIQSSEENYNIAFPPMFLGGQNNR